MKKIILLALFISFLNLSCSVYETLVNISRLKFKLGEVNNFSVNGINISNKSRLQDFTAQQLLQITSAVTRGQLPVSFTLNVQAKNPNDGTGGYRKTNATIKSFPYRLMINEKETISGNIGAPVTVPGTGEITNIPFTFSLDLVNFFEEKGYQDLINLALNIGGAGGSTSNLAVFAQPTVTTSFGDITYPKEIKIINANFTN